MRHARWLRVMHARYRWRYLSPGRALGRAMELGRFLHPSPALAVFQRHERVVRPVKVIGEIGYLLVKLVEGVAYDSPRGSGSTSNSCWQCGQVTLSARVPLPLMRL